VTEEKIFFPLEEWAFHKLLPRQLKDLYKPTPYRINEEWLRCHNWEFFRERYNIDSNFRKKIDSKRAENDQRWKEITEDKKKMKAYESEDEQNISELWKDSGFSPPPYHGPTKPLAFPLASHDSPLNWSLWPKVAYLSVPLGVRVPLVREGDTEMGWPGGGKKESIVYIDFEWPTTLAVAHFKEWYQDRISLITHRGAVPEHGTKTSHGRLKTLQADLKALGATRLKKNCGTVEKAIEYASNCHSDLYDNPGEFSIAKNRVKEVLGSKKYF
jgi:hypothetical protein